jgi:hypothetical protein
MRRQKTACEKALEAIAALVKCERLSIQAKLQMGYTVEMTIAEATTYKQRFAAAQEHIQRST